jgi:hypothetical protein
MHLLSRFQGKGMLEVELAVAVADFLKVHLKSHITILPQLRCKCTVDQTCNSGILEGLVECKCHSNPSLIQPILNR